MCNYVLRNATEDTVFPMSDGDKITRNEIIQLSVPYKGNNPTSFIYHVKFYDKYFVSAD